MKHGCVILADRHPGLLEGIRGLLESMFETVVMVADRESLFKTVQNLQPQLAIVDLSLNDTNGTNIICQCHERFPELKFIILSVYDEPDIVKSVMDTGAAGFVLKRSAGTDLIPAIEAVVEGRTYVSPLENQ
jgi:DNA-binding NarL/FixJ family response regulator